MSRLTLYGAYLVSAPLTSQQQTRRRGGCSHSQRVVCVLREQYDAQVTVGGRPCPAATNDVGLVQCLLPDFDFDPTVAYDVAVFNDAASLTLGGLVQYSGAPTLLGVDPCIDRGQGYLTTFTTGVQCPVGSTITLHGARFPTTADAVAVQYAYSYTDTSTIALLAPAVVNASTVTAVLPALNSLSAYVVNLVYATVRLSFTTGNVTTTTNTLRNSLYLPPDSPAITSVSSASCDSLSPLQLTNCRAMAVITVTGSNLQLRNGVFFATSTPAGELLAYDFLLPSNSSIVSLSNTSLVFTLDYFDADTNVQLQPNVVYSNIAIAEAGVYDSLLTWRYSNAFYLSLTYDTADTNSSSKRLSSGAVAGIVIAAVAVALLLVAAVAWLVRRQLSSKSAGGELQWAMRGGGGSSSDEYKDVELH